MQKIKKFSLGVVCSSYLSRTMIYLILGLLGFYFYLYHVLFRTILNKLSTI